MRKGLAVGLVCLSLLWGVFSWIKAHGMVDFLSLIFIVVSIVALGLFTVRLAGGEHSG